MSAPTRESDGAKPEDEPQTVPLCVAMDRVAVAQRMRDAAIAECSEARVQLRQVQREREALETANAALCEEIRRLKAELHQEREANRPLRHELQQARKLAVDAGKMFMELLKTLEPVIENLTDEEAADLGVTGLKLKAMKGPRG